MSTATNSDRMATANDVPEKFQRVIDGLLNHEYTVTKDVYLEMLLSHLSDKNGKGGYRVFGMKTKIIEYQRQTRLVFVCEVA